MEISDHRHNAALSFDSQVWARIFDALPDGILVTDSDFTIRFANHAFGAIIGKDAAALIGRKCFDIFAGTLCRRPRCPLTLLASGLARVDNESEEHCKDGGRLPGSVSCTAFMDATGGFGGMVERITDARVLRKAREDLHLSHERLRKTMGALIQAMSLTIEKRDAYTAGHQRRTAKLCRAIATELGFSWERIQQVRMTAAIHDLGKIHVPAAILNKPGAMSEHEMAIIRQHPETAYQILKGIDFPWPLAETIRQHHERLDGSGYPRGLKGDAIILEARILAVADVVESIASFRPYRPAYGMAAALAELRKGSGVLYDEKIVAICEALIRERGFDFKTKSWQHRPVRRNKTN
jgi:PAS domain S-box-containing protein